MTNKERRGEVRRGEIIKERWTVMNPLKLRAKSAMTGSEPMLRSVNTKPKNSGDNPARQNILGVCVCVSV